MECSSFHGSYLWMTRLHNYNSCEKTETRSNCVKNAYMLKKKWKIAQGLLTEGVKPSYGFFPALESAKSLFAFWIYDTKPPG